jgi:NADH-quinone oxidoreductase subunit A
MFMYPWIFTLKDTINFHYNFWIMLDFIFELFIGFIYAWKVGALDWD